MNLDVVIEGIADERVAQAIKRQRCRAWKGVDPPRLRKRGINQRNVRTPAGPKWEAD